MRSCSFGDHYTVYEDGTIISYRKKGKEKNIAHTKNRSDNQYYANLWVKGERKRIGVHRIIASNFVPNPKKYNLIKFKDGDKSNVNASNLVWVKGILPNRKSITNLNNRIITKRLKQGVYRQKIQHLEEEIALIEKQKEEIEGNI